ncbi:MAG TPA: zinc ribbon domain-containing protein, partial [Candidatus Ozemobacteraceae bacterium]
QESPPSPSQPAGMQKRPCPACGHRCPPEASFCRACGTPLAGASTPCTTCGEPLKPEDTICASCGTACPSLNSGRQQPDGVVQTAPLSNAPSLTGIGFLLGLLLTGQIVMIASNSSPDVLLREQVLIRLAVGYAAALLGFLTGTRGGLSRLLTLLLSGGFVFIEGRRLIPAFNIVANSPDLLSTLAPALGINILFFLTGLWICKRACQFSG